MHNLIRADNNLVLNLNLNHEKFTQKLSTRFTDATILIPVIQMLLLYLPSLLYLIYLTIKKERRKEWRTSVFEVVVLLIFPLVTNLSFYGSKSQEKNEKKETKPINKKTFKHNVKSLRSNSFSGFQQFHQTMCDEVYKMDEKKNIIQPQMLQILKNTRLQSLPELYRVPDNLHENTEAIDQEKSFETDISLSLHEDHESDEETFSISQSNNLFMIYISGAVVILLIDIGFSCIRYDCSEVRISQFSRITRSYAFLVALKICFWLVFKILYNQRVADNEGNDVLLAVTMVMFLLKEVCQCVS